MSSFGMLVLCLVAVATLQMTNGQMDNWNNLWGGHGNRWTGQWGGHGSVHWGSWDDEEEATTAVCAAAGGGGKKGKPTLAFQATIKKISNKWFQHRSGLKIDVEIVIFGARFDELKLVLTMFGATDNFDMCTVGNLGRIVTGRKQPHHFQTGNSNGVIATFEDLHPGDRIEETFRNLPISRLEDVYGCGLALCTDVKRVSDGGSGWDWGWNARMKPDKFECEGEIPVCCHLGKSDGDSDGQPSKGP